MDLNKNFQKKTQEEISVGKNLCDSELGKDFLYRTHKKMNHKEKLTNQILLKFRTSTPKDTVKK